MFKKQPKSLSAVINFYFKIGSVRSQINWQDLSFGKLVMKMASDRHWFLISLFSQSRLMSVSFLLCILKKYFCKWPALIMLKFCFPCLKMKYFNPVFKMLYFEWMTKQEQDILRFFLLKLLLKVTSPIVNNWTNFHYVSGKFLELVRIVSHLKGCPWNN